MRKATIAIALVMLMVTSGCLGFVQGDKPLSFAADPATASDAALEDTGYDNETVQEVSMNRSFEFENRSREVEVTNWNVRYDKSVGIGSMSQTGAMFMTFTTPKFSIAGQSLNPVGNMTNEELLDRAVAGKAGFKNVTTVEENKAVVLGKGTTVTTFRATVEGGDGMFATEQDMKLHVTKVAHKDDYVIAIGAHPVELNEGENILRLMESLEHDGN